jgi:hypothetical protein
MIWYCYKNGSHIVCRSIEGLLIRGIPETLIFEVEAETRIDASNKAAEVINAVRQKIKAGRIGSK